jgi:ATP-dependent Clp protease ATP-binding subunit ClpC
LTARVRFQELIPTLLSGRARKAFQLANQEAQRLNHSAVGTEHLLLGLAKEALSPAATLLRQAGFGLPGLRRRVARLHAPGSDETLLPGSLPYADDVATFLKAVVAAAEACGVVALTPELLLLALLEYPTGLAGRLLRQRRLGWRWLRWQLRRRA